MKEPRTDNHLGSDEAKIGQVTGHHMIHRAEARLVSAAPVDLAGIAETPVRVHRPQSNIAGSVPLRITQLERILVVGGADDLEYPRTVP